MARPPEGAPAVGGGRVGGTVYTGGKKSPAKPKPKPPPWQGTGENKPIPEPEIDIDKILANDPTWLALLERLKAESISDRASRDQAIQRAMIDFGYLPGGGLPGLGALSKEEIDAILNPTTRGLIEANTRSGMSVWARLQATAARAQDQMLDAVGARGGFRSGMTPWGLQRSAEAAEQGRYDATKNLMDYLTGVQSAFVTAERERTEKLDETRLQIIGDYDVPEPQATIQKPLELTGFKPGDAGAGVQAPKYALPPPGVNQANMPWNQPGPPKPAPSRGRRGRRFGSRFPEGQPAVGGGRR